MIGKQFEWHSHYPGDDGRFGRRDISLITPTNAIGLDRSDPNGADDIVSINQMNLPINKPVIVYLSSQGRHPQHGHRRDAGEAGRGARHSDPGLVGAERARPVRGQLLAALRPRPLPDARLRDRHDPGRLRRLARGGRLPSSPATSVPSWKYAAYFSRPLPRTDCAVRSPRRAATGSVLLISSVARSAHLCHALEGLDTSRVHFQSDDREGVDAIGRPPVELRSLPSCHPNAAALARSGYEAVDRRSLSRLSTSSLRGESGNRCS